MAKFIYDVIPIGLQRVNDTKYELTSELREESDGVELMGANGWELVAIWPNSKEYLDEYHDDDHDQHRFINLGVFKKQVG